MEKEKDKEVKPKNRHLFKHREHLNYVADRILTTSPTREIIFNSLLGIYELAYAEGYQTRLSDSRYFKDKQESRRKESWNAIRDHIDDLCHKEESINQQSK